jgi:hypothetical protein
LLVIGSRIDEAWQVLHHLRDIDNPLAVRASLLGYLFSSIRSAISQNTAVARILGSKSYRNLGNRAKLATALMHLLTFLFLVGVIYASYQLNRGDFSGVALAGVLFLLFLILVMILIGSTMLLGESVFSAYFSPIRSCFLLMGSFSVIPREIGTYLIRLKGWSVLLKAAMGLEGYQFELPVTCQFPHNLSKDLLVYENMPMGAEKHALVRRSAWVARHLGDVSHTFSKLVVTAADIQSLLRTIEEDQTLVHAAYYTDDECIARIADWIAVKDGIPSNAVVAAERAVPPETAALRNFEARP